MKKIEATVNPNEVEEVREGLVRIGIEQMDLSEVEGFSRHIRLERIFRGMTYPVGSVRRVKIEFVVPDRFSTYLWVPLSPHCCLMVNQYGSGDVSREDAIMLNKTAVQHSVRYIFARDLSRTGIDWSLY